ncbi:hypothetical protein ACOMHN_020779 [Nucella lapillus]
MVNILTVVACLSCGILVLGAPTSKCPPGGRYFDKHVGQYGRFECCSDICKNSVYQNLCHKKCPDYDKIKAAEESKTTTVHPPNLATTDASADDDLPPNKPATDQIADKSVIIIFVVCMVAIGIVAIIIAVVVGKRGQPGKNGSVIRMNSLQRIHSEDHATQQDLLHDTHPEGGVNNGSRLEGGRPDQNQHSWESRPTVSYFVQTAKEEQPPVQVEDPLQ